MIKKMLLIISLSLFSCKSDTHTSEATEYKIDASVYKMWNDYKASNPKSKKEELPESWFFHNNKKDANHLGQLTLKGKKQAATGLYTWYKNANVDLPKTGTKHIITDFDGEALAIIEIKKVDTIPFNKITDTYASLDMGTSKAPLTKWKKAHWDFFESALKESNQKPSEDMLVVCEWFETIWPKQ